AVRRAKRAFFDNVMYNVHPQKIWDMVEWTKPRRLHASIGILKPDGSPPEGPEEMADVLHGHFSPSTPRAVDPTFIADIPQRPERDFPPFSADEVLTNLRTTSNMSAPGPDHLPW
ncbi:hypothetical protein BDW22DRAFT_1296361, partial [Trametopsis cervina]